MAWHIRRIDDGIIETVFEGLVSGEEMLEAAAERIRIGKVQNVTRFLLDARKMIAPRSATMDVFKIPTKVYQEKEVDRTTRIGVVPPADQDSGWIVNFYEDLCYTRGWSIKICRDRQNAIDWLRT